MNNSLSVSVHNLSKRYMLYEKPRDRLKNSLFRHFGKAYGHEFWALHDIHFELHKGETLGVIGRNGSGKSTLLQIIAGTLAATTGEVRVNGRVAALLELGSGFNPEYTGRENVFMNGAMLGISRKKMEGRLEQIIDFADIGEFIDQPVKSYSSGMFVRLAFAVQACMDPEILIVDEALSVGDIFFQQKCHARMEELLKRKTAIILVSHDMGLIERYSTRTLLLDKGRCLFLGQPNQAVEYFYTIERPSGPSALSFSAPLGLMLGAAVSLPQEEGNISDWPQQEAFLDLSTTVAIGEKEIAKCTAIALCDDRGHRSATFQIGEIAYFFFEFELLQDIQVPIGGVVLTNRMNINVHGKSSLEYLTKAPEAVMKGTRVRFRQKMELSLAPGEYSFMIVFSTMKVSDYELAGTLNYESIAPRINTILRIRQAGTFSVHMRTKGQSLPFHGCADLKGNIALAVLKEPGNRK